MKPYLFRAILSLGIAGVLVSCDEDSYPDNGDITPGRDSDKVCFIVSGNNASRSGSAGGRCSGGAYLHSGNNGDSIYLGLTVAPQPVMPESRAAHITEAGYSTLRMTCLKRTDEGQSYYFSNIAFSKDATGTWISNPPYWWLDGNTHFKFYGYAPADAKGVTYVKDEQTWQPKLDYAVPTDVKQQTDLIYNTLVPEYVASANQTVPLTMSHALANVAFRTGKGMAAGRISKVTVHNVAGKGTLNLTDGKWSLDPESVTDFSASIGKTSADGLDITNDADRTYFMLLPGCNSKATTVEIEFVFANGVTRTFNGPLTDVWEAGKQYLYTVTVSPDLDITVVPETQDAHYVICRAKVSGANMQQGQKWVLTATASDGANVTLLPQLSEYQRNGFWTDRIIGSGGNDMGSARGESTLTGTGESDVYVFLPENATDNNRTVTLAMKVEGTDRIVSEKTFTQLHPAWTNGGFGWEQTDDNLSGEYGFNWNRTACYTYLYTGSTRTQKERYKAYCQSIINQNNAGGYSSVKDFYYSVTWPPAYGDRYYIYIDYSLLNNLQGKADSRNDGLANTKNLFSLGGSVVTNSFETAILSVYKTESGHTTERAFRIGNGANNEAPAPTGANINGSIAAGECMKKNRYDLLVTKSEDGDESRTPVIKDKDIVWYLPAVEQFNDIPATIHNAVAPAQCWSSTAYSNSTSAYLGSGNTAERLSTHNVRACRNRP